eukprot:NODE_6970_length_271_cov_334.243243_g6358_i0.p2 GENE.NODE_6970_length_271_cov_334.243243_g6358_i0~~NODE_6970_length_271_cov_334.243243_g6358_i0.p2  ORF type:complete len:79 (-),score=29.14 NODE_6970_length_271_cov_334.243243_g6358_i0:33-242(-)
MGGRSAAPQAVAFDAQGMVYVDDTDASSVGVEHIQVYHPGGKFLRQFGGKKCGPILCQTFNGLEFVPSV